jgi:hypothetical protein
MGRDRIPIAGIFARRGRLPPEPYQRSFSDSGCACVRSAEMEVVRGVQQRHRLPA